MISNNLKLSTLCYVVLARRLASIPPRVSPAFVIPHEEEKMKGNFQQREKKREDNSF